MWGKSRTLLLFLSSLLACLHDQNKSGFFEGRTFNQPIRAIYNLFKELRLARKKPALQKSHFCFDYVNRLIVLFDSNDVSAIKAFFESNCNS